jgi:hypothetical protein
VAEKCDEIAVGMRPQSYLVEHVWTPSGRAWRVSDCILRWVSRANGQQPTEPAALRDRRPYRLVSTDLTAFSVLTLKLRCATGASAA